MKKYLCLSVIIIFYLCIFNTGCIQEENSNNDSKDNETNGFTSTFEDIELINFTVETQEYTFDGRYKKISDGFVYNEDSYRYLIRGIIRNLAEENISKLWVVVNFYDSDDKLLFSMYDIIFDFLVNETRDFEADYTKFIDGFPYVESVRFEFKV